MASYSVSPAEVLVRTRQDIYEGCSALRRASPPSPLYGRRTGPKLMYSFVLPVEFHRLQSDCSISSGLLTPT